MRFWRVLDGALIAAAAMLAPTSPHLLAGEAPVRPQGNLVVHEWGVAIRQPTASGTLLSSPAELVAGLPPFVVREKSARTLQPQGWDKPVIWLRGTEGMKVSVKVMASQGFATAHFPAAEVLLRRFSHVDRKAMMVSLLTETAGLRWEGTLTAKPMQKVPAVARDHWWNAARAGGGMYFNTKGASEAFLFHEATAFQEPTVSAVMGADSITIRNSHAAASGQVIVLVNTADKHFVHTVDTIPPKADVTASRDGVMKRACSPAEVLAACAGQWNGFGITKVEAATITQVWKEDLLKPQRIILISRMPADLYDAMFPLTIEPAPTDLVRVGMLFDALDTQWDAPSWLPEVPDQRKDLEKVASGLGSADFAEREATSLSLTRQGPRAIPMLEALARSKDPEVSTLARALLAALVPKADTPTREGRDEAGVMVQAIKP